MKKRMISILLLTALLFTGCGTADNSEAKLSEEAAQEAAVMPDPETLYAQVSEGADLPEMILLTPEKAEKQYGVAAEDCLASVIAVSADSVRSDEIWLVEAVSEEAAQRVYDCASARLQAKREETENYFPDQYDMLKKAVLLQDSIYVIFLAMPESGTAALMIQNLL